MLRFDVLSNNKINKKLTCLSIIILLLFKYCAPEKRQQMLECYGV